MTRFSGFRKMFCFLTIVVMLTGMAGTVGVSAEEKPDKSEWGILDTFSNLLGSSAAENADQVMQRDLYTGSVNGMEFTLREAGYDGRTLFLRCGYRIPDVTTAFGVTAAEVYGEYLPAGMKPESFVEGLRDEGNEFLQANGIGWWCDQFWIDGNGVPLAVGAKQSVSGSSQPGEIIETDFLPLGKLGIFLNGTVRISLPVGAGPDRTGSDPETHPEMYDADGFLKLPEKGVITFELDTKDILSQVRTFHPERETDLPGFTAKVGEAAFTPFLTYITVDLALNPGAMEAFIAKNGEGETDENGDIIIRYGPIDITTPWLESLRLVDGNGTVLFPEQGGLEEQDEQKAEFVYSGIETLPDALYLAPVDEATGKADLDRAVPVM